jgi:hypothetical protein
MGDVVQLPINRASRRARFAVKKREDRALGRHQCKVEADAVRHGLNPNALHRIGQQAIRVPPLMYHELHRILGEPHCPLCLRCGVLKRDARIERPQVDRALVLAAWEALLTEAQR